jgi:hypothetical protein
MFYFALIILLVCAKASELFPNMGTLFLIIAALAVGAYAGPILRDRFRKKQG